MLKITTLQILTSCCTGQTCRYLHRIQLCRHGYLNYQIEHHIWPLGCKCCSAIILSNGYQTCFLMITRYYRFIRVLYFITYTIQYDAYLYIYIYIYYIGDDHNHSLFQVRYSLWNAFKSIALERAWSSSSPTSSSSSCLLFFSSSLPSSSSSSSSSSSAASSSASS